jgi:hypothetical protein
LPACSSDKMPMIMLTYLKNNQKRIKQTTRARSQRDALFAESVSEGSQPGAHHFTEFGVPVAARVTCGRKRAEV